MPETPSDALPAPDPDARTETVRDRGAGRARRPHWIEKLETGSAVGRYVILERIGAGGMGVVYGAFDPDLDRKIALKFLRSEVSEADDQAPERLLREARVLARLEHPHVVTVYDVGTFQGNVFIAMAFGRGATLRRWLRRERRDWRQVLAVFEQAGRGLAAAHATGVVHRDFKPDNVMISDDGVAQVLDFGLARKVSELPTDADPSEKDLLDFTLTRTGEVFGTPAYMAPEQHLGFQADTRSDQFAFCVSLYEALYGEHPFADRTPGESRRRILTGELKEPPADAEVPGWLRRALLRGLSTDPDRRYPDVDALLEALRADPSRARRRWLSGSAAALVVLGVLTVLGLRLQSRSQLCTGGEARLARVWNEAVRETARQAFLSTGERYAADTWRSVERLAEGYAEAWGAMYRNACEATHLRGEQSAEMLDLRMACLDRRFRRLQTLTELWTRADAAVVENAVEAAGALSGLDECANATALTARVKPPSDPALTTRVHGLEDRLAELAAMEAAGHYEEWLGAARAAATEAEAVAYPPTQSAAFLERGRAEAAADLVDEARRSLRQALRLAMQGGDDLVMAEAALELAWLEGHDLLRLAEGRDWAQLAAAAIARAGGDEVLEGQLLSDLAAMSYLAGDYEEALQQASQALDLRARAPGAESYEYTETLNNLATIETDVGRYEDAIHHLERALEIRRPMLGPEHPLIASTLNNLGSVYTATGDHAKALELFRQVLAIYRNAIRPVPADVAKALSNVAATLDRLGRHEEALEHGLEALSLKVEALGEDHVEVGISLINLGSTYRDFGRFSEALESVRQARRIFEKALGTEHPYVAYALNAIGVMHTVMGEPELAIEPLEQARALRRRAGDEPKNYAGTCFSLAKALHAAGRDLGRAVDLAREARDVFAGLEGVSVEADLAEIEAWLDEREGS